MVKEIRKQGKQIYQCEICKFKYEDKNLARKCQEWCKKYKSCNIEIIKHALK